jgi:hypothetical protein
MDIVFREQQSWKTHETIEEDALFKRDLSQSTSSALVALYNFTSQWFLIPQGTGIIGVILHPSNYQFKGLDIISYIVWLLTIVMLACMLAIYVLRYTAFPHMVTRSLGRGMSESACLASISISFTSIIQMMVLALVQGGWGKGWAIAAYVLWWINVAMAVLCVVVVPFIYIRLYPNGVPHLSPASQLRLAAVPSVNLHRLARSSRSRSLSCPISLSAWAYRSHSPWTFYFGLGYWTGLCRTDSTHIRT